MAQNAVAVGEGGLTDWISIGVLASSVPRDAVDEAVAVTGKQAKRSDGRLPPHVMVYFAMAMALFAEEDYEEVAERLTETLAEFMSTPRRTQTSRSPLTRRRCRGQEPTRSFG